MPGDVSFMGRETKSLDLMAGKPLPANNDEPVSSHDASTDTHEDSTITYASSTLTHEGSTATAVTHEGSTLNGQSSSFEHSITSQELSNVDVQRNEEIGDVSQSTPKQTIHIVSQKVVFAVPDDNADGPHPNNSDVFDDKPSTSDVVSNDSGDVPSTSQVVPNDSEDVPTSSENVTTTTNVALNISYGVPSTSEDVSEHSTATMAYSSDKAVHSSECENGASNVEELSTPVNNEVVEDKTSEDNTEADHKPRHSSTDSEPSVNDSKI